MLTKLLIDLREYYIHTFKKKIILIEKDKLIITNKSIIIPINFFYFFCIKDLLKYNKINSVYKLDGIIFYDNNIKHKITINQLILEFNVINSNEINNLTDNINKYSKHVPFYIIVEIEKININSKIHIKLLNICNIIIKEYKTIDILYKYLYELF